MRWHSSSSGPRRLVWPCLRERIVELHDDEVPEILALPISDGLPDYLRWLDDATTPCWLAEQPQTEANWRPYFEVYHRGRHTVAGDIGIVQGCGSPELDNRRDIMVYLPPWCLDKIRRYPVIYMHDGQNLFDAATGFAGEWYVDETMEELADEGIEAIVVGIPNIGERRFHQYIPFPAPDLPDVQGDEYVAFIADTVKPIIDRDFRTLADAASTGIAGSSLGGLISLYAMFRRPDVFGLAGVFSPALRWGPERHFPLHASGALRTRQDLPGRRHRRGDRTGGGRPVAAVVGEPIPGAGAEDESTAAWEEVARAGHDLLYVEEEGKVFSHESAWARRLPPR